MKILIATHNPAKIKDYCQLLEKEGFKVETLASLDIRERFAEHQDSFEQNAQNKALFYYNLAKIPTIAEDGGFEIDYLNGEPGIKSRRWPGHEATDEEIVNYLREKIKEIPQDQRSAKFTAVTCLIKSPNEIYQAKNSLEGYLIEVMRKDYPTGWPYRAFFIEKNFNKYLMDLTEAEYNQINHRLKNIEELIKYLN